MPNNRTFFECKKFNKWYVLIVTSVPYIHNKISQTFLIAILKGLYNQALGILFYSYIVAKKKV